MDITKNKYHFSNVNQRSMNSCKTLEEIGDVITQSINDYFNYAELEKWGPSLRYDSAQWRLMKANVGRPAGMAPIVPRNARGLVVENKKKLY